MTGTAYVTTYSDELAKYFVPDKEIILYSDRNELLEKIKYYTGRPEEAIAIGAAGRSMYDAKRARTGVGPVMVLGGAPVGGQMERGRQAHAASLGYLARLATGQTG